MKSFFKLIRHILVLSLWSYAYVYALKIVLMKNWGFDPTSQDHWEYIKEQWQEGWVIKETSDVIFALTLLGTIPIWIIGFFICNFLINRIKSSKKAPVEDIEIPKTVTKGPRRPPAISPKQKKNRSFDVSKNIKAKSQPSNEAVAIRETPVTQTQNTASVNNAMQIEETPAPVTISQQPAATVPQNYSDNTALKATSAVSSILQPTIKPEWDTLLKNLHDFASQRGYVVFSSMQIGKHEIDYVLLSSKAIYLICMSPEGDEWISDEESFSDDPPVWFSENNFSDSPAFKVSEAKKILIDSLSSLMPEGYEYNVESIVALGYGVIINSQEMIPTWHDMDVKIGTFATGNTVGANKLDDLLPDISSQPPIPDEILNIMSLSLVSSADDEDDDE